MVTGGFRTNPIALPADVGGRASIINVTSMARYPTP